MNRSERHEASLLARRRWYAKNAERRRAESREWRRKNPDRVRQNNIANNQRTNWPAYYARRKLRLALHKFASTCAASRRAMETA